MSELEEHIDRLTTTSIKRMVGLLAPTCITCPHRMHSVDVIKSAERMRDRVTITTRCANKEVKLRRCPDDGNPEVMHAKDIGMKRTLFNSPLAHSFEASEAVEARASHKTIKALVRSPSYGEWIEDKFQQEDNILQERLHIWNETLNFVSAPMDMSDDSVLWIGTCHETVSSAIESLEQDHIREYHHNKDYVDSICQPTTYMKSSLPKDSQTPFGVFTEYERKDDGSTRIRGHKASYIAYDEVGEMNWPRPKEYVPEKTNEELYENWGNYA